MAKAEVTIIGAGPAGSVCALLLARQGFPVTLIEQHRFPRDKVCGECLSSLGIDTLERIGLLPGLQQLHSVALTHATIHNAGGASARMKLPRPMWGISRRSLDGFLLDAARDAGATVRQPARCEALVEGPPIAVRVRDTESNRIETLYPEHVILADGKSALLGTTPPPRTGDFGIKTHFEGVDGPRDTIELFGCRGLYGGLAPIESGRWNAAFSIPAHRLRQHRGNVDALFEQILSENAALARRLAPARRMTDWLASSLPRFPVQTKWPAHVIPIGNAAAAIEPIGGEGMGLALRSAEQAARVIIDGTTVPGLRELAGDYQRLWRVRRPCCRAAAIIVSKPRLAGALIPWAPRIPAASAWALRLLGK